MSVPVEEKNVWPAERERYTSGRSRREIHLWPVEERDIYFHVKERDVRPVEREINLQPVEEREREIFPAGQREREISGRLKSEIFPEMSGQSRERYTSGRSRREIS